MRILPVSFFTPRFNQHNNKQRNYIQNTIESPHFAYAYRDFNISFSGRTPENFYAQDFNRNNMPHTMREFLDTDYESRQHIPPEQMMGIVFNKLKILNDFDEVKRAFPDEDLFNGLHENNIKSRKGILTEIEVAREIGSSPLLKDGSDNFGMYLLKKIYVEGKTLKEISKDFLEKDINEEYRDFITEPVKYATLSAYGIKYPKQEFWHSFIHTRNDYKEFFKSQAEIDNILRGSKTSSNSYNRYDTGSENVSHPQKPKHRMSTPNSKHLKKEIGEQKVLDEENVKRAVRKRFGKDNPEASFLIRYMSPIMTVAAERIHLSEEMKLFTEDEKLNGRNSDEKTMFGRFWKQNPQMRYDFSDSIVYTMELFERLYNDGGDIAINKNFEQIKNPKNTTEKILDYVNEDFLDILNYTQSLDSERNAKYTLHDKTQKELEEMFAKYDLETKEIQAAEVLEPDEILENVAKINNANVYILKTVNGDDFRLVCNVDEVYNEKLNSDIKYMPTKYGQKYLKFMRNDENVSDKFKLSFAAEDILNMIEDPKVMSVKELKDTRDNLFVNFVLSNLNEEYAADFAIMDTLIKLSNYEITPSYSLKTYDYNMIFDNSEEGRQIGQALKKNRALLDSFYETYTKPMTESEKNKVLITLMNLFKNYNIPNNCQWSDDYKNLFLMLQESTSMNSTRKELLKRFIYHDIKLYPYAKSFLDKKCNNAQNNAKFEQLIEQIIRDIILYSNSDSENSALLTLLNRRIYNKYYARLSSDLQNILNKNIQNASPTNRIFFESN